MTVEKFRLPAYAKINWFLQILGKREDNFHELCTVFQTISLGDFLTFSESGEIELSCDNSNISVDETNLIFRAAQLLKNEYEIKSGAQIHLEKNIPSPGGLGGGSADAAVALIGLRRLWKLNVTIEKLSQLSAKLGSDVPFFFCGGTAIGAGRGTDISPIGDYEKKYLLVVTPDVVIPTADAFRLLNAPRLTNSGSKSILEICCNEAENRLLTQRNFANDFETTVFKIAPEIERVKNKLLETGASVAVLSGSGASVYGIFENKETRQASLVALENEKNWRKFAVATVSRAVYREKLGLFPISF